MFHKTFVLLLNKYMETLHMYKVTIKLIYYLTYIHFELYIRQLTKHIYA